MSGASTAVAWFVLNLFGQVTVVCTAALLASLALRRNAAARKCVLSCGLVCVAACPIFALLVQISGLGYRIDPASWMAAADPDLQVTEAPGRFASAAPAPLAETDDRPAPASTDVGNEPFRTDEWTTIPEVNWTLLVLLATWLLVTLVLLLGLARSYWRLRRIIAESTPVQEPAANRLVRELTRTYRGPAPTVRVSDAIRTPIAAGPWRPMAILPRGIAERVTHDELRAILLHEVAHVRGRDPLVLLLQQIVAAVYWPHPLIHVQNRCLARAREEVCDNHVLAEIQPKAYGELLLRIGRHLSPPEVRSPLVGFLPFTRNLESRIRGLLDKRRVIVTRTRNRTRFAMAAAMLAVTGIVTSIALSQEEAADPNVQADAGEQGPHAAMRTWTDRTGKYTTNARMVAFENDTVRLRKDDDKLVSVPLARLSAADQEYVREFAERGQGSSRQQEETIAVEYTPAPNEAEKRIYATLSLPATLAFESLGLSEFATTLRGEFELPIELQLPADFDTSQVMLTAEGGEMPLEIALTRIFDGTGLGFMVINGALVFLPQGEVEIRQIERTYAVEKITKDSRELQDLIAALTTTCHPTDWSYVGGMGEVVPLERPRRLHIQQAFDVHQEIIRFLRACNAMQAVAERDDAIGDFIDSLESEDKATRAAAYYMLVRLGPKAKPAVPALVRALAIQFDRRTFFDDLAAHTLVRIGQAAIPELTKAASGDDENLARQAQRVLDRIRGTPGLGGGLNDASGGGFF